MKIIGLRALHVKPLNGIMGLPQNTIPKGLKMKRNNTDQDKSIRKYIAIARLDENIVGLAYTDSPGAALRIIANQMDPEAKDLYLPSISGQYFQYQHNSEAVQDEGVELLEIPIYYVSKGEGDHQNVIEDVRAAANNITYWASGV